MRKIGMSIPKLFLCPISLELFTDPVTLCTGQTYDRPFIEKWMSSGNLTCPVTMQKLHDLSMVPNHTLSHLIHQWLQQKGHHHHHDHHDHHDGQFDDYYCIFCKVGCSNFVVSLASLKQTLESKDLIFEEKIQALDQVRCLIEDFPNKIEGLIQMGFFSLMLDLCFGGRLSREIMGLVEKSLDCALKLLPFCCLSDVNALMEESNFKRFRVLVKEGSFMVKINLFKLIEAISMSLSLETRHLTNKIGNDTKVIKVLITSLDDSQHNFEVSEAGIKAIFGLITSLEGAMYRENFIKQGLVHSLVRYILKVLEMHDEEKKLLARKATRALEKVLELESGKEAFLENEVPNGVRALVKMVFRVLGDDEGSESALNSLMILCCESLKVREEAICGGILTQLLLLLQSQCSGRTKTRARLLLKFLRSMWTKDPMQHV